MLLPIRSNGVTQAVRFPPFLLKLIAAVFIVPVVLTCLILYAGNQARQEGGPSDEIPQQYWIVGENAVVEASNNTEPCPATIEELRGVTEQGAVIRRGGTFVHDRIENGYPQTGA